MKEYKISILVSDSAHRSLLIILITFLDLTKLGKLQYVKSLKLSISKFHFSVKLYEIRKNVIIQNCLLQKDLQV